METVRIVTHSGGFHADDVFAMALLKKISEAEGKKVEIIRSRDLEVIKTGTYAVDVGGVYDWAAGRFDHHQEGGAGERENGIPYSSFGLVWKHFGERVTGSPRVFAEVEKILVMPIDANDCGVLLCQPTREDVWPLSISFLTHFFEPSWKDVSDENLLQGFLEAVDFAQNLTEKIILRTKDSEEAEEFVRGSIEKRKEPQILVLEKYLPWDAVVSKTPEILFVVYPHPSGAWSVKTARDSLSYFKSRKDLPLSWAGKKDEELQKITGVPEATFCHNARFTCGAKTKEGALALARLALLSN